MGKMSPLKIVDVAPILLRSLSVPLEVEMDGVCPEALFDGCPVLATVPDEFVPTLERKQTSLDLEEVQTEVLKRLRAIGYLAQ